MSIAKKKLLINPLTGDFNLVSTDNFSFDTVPVGKIVDIPQYQQMIVYQSITVDGVLNIDGSLGLIDS